MIYICTYKMFLMMNDIDMMSKLHFNRKFFGTLLPPKCDQTFGSDSQVGLNMSKSKLLKYRNLHIIWCIGGKKKTCYQGECKHATPFLSMSVVRYCSSWQNSAKLRLYSSFESLVILAKTIGSTDLTLSTVTKTHKNTAVGVVCVSLAAGSLSLHMTILWQNASIFAQ